MFAEACTRLAIEYGVEVKVSSTFTTFGGEKCPVVKLTVKKDQWVLDDYIEEWALRSYGYDDILSYRLESTAKTLLESVAMRKIKEEPNDD